MLKYINCAINFIFLKSVSFEALISPAALAILALLLSPLGVSLHCLPGTSSTVCLVGLLSHAALAG